MNKLILKRIEYSIIDPSEINDAVRDRYEEFGGEGACRFL